MLDDTARTLLRQPLVARLSTIGPDGYPHTVPVWFMLDGDDIVIISDRATRKIGHIEANPRGAVCIGGESSDQGGYLLKGDFSVEPDRDHHWLKKVTYHYEDGQRAEDDIALWGKLDMVVIRLKVKTAVKVI